MFDPTVYVLNENKLVYAVNITLPGGWGTAFIMEAKPEPGGWTHHSGAVPIGPDDRLRKAVVEDFAFFRVSPKGHLPDSEISATAKPQG